MLKKILPFVRKNKILVFILFIAALLRFGGIYPGFNLYHSDEPILYGQAIHIVKENTLDPGRYDYPSISIYINSILYKLFFIPLGWIKYYLSHIPQLFDGVINLFPSKLERQRLLVTEIFGNRNLNVIYWGRIITAIFSLGCVYLTYLLGEKVFKNKKIGLIAAFLLAFNFKHVVNSHIVLPDSYNSFFLLLSIIHSFRLYDKPDKKRYLLAGILAGLSFSTKYQIYAFLPLFTVHFLVSLREKKFIKSIFNPYFFLSIISAVLVFVITNPFFFIHFEEAKRWNMLDVKKYKMGLFKPNFYLLSFMYYYDYGVLLLSSVILGLIISFKLNFQKTLILFAPVVFFAFMFFFYSAGGFYVRNLIPISPFLLIFASILLECLFRFITKNVNKKFHKPLFILVLLIISFVPIRNSVISTFYYLKDWNYTTMSEWITKNLPQDKIIAATPWDLPTGAVKNEKTDFEILGSYSMAEHKDDGAEYSLWNFISHAVPFYSWMYSETKDLKYFWKKPLYILRNTYYGLAVEEMVDNAVYVSAKPGVSSDHTLILSKIIDWSNLKYKQHVVYDFNSGFEGWKIYGLAIDANPQYVLDDTNGKNMNGSILYLPDGARISVLRATSPLIEVKTGYVYKVRAFLKTENELGSQDRDGFIRIDFYQYDGREDKGIVSSVSSRVYGTTNWVEKTIYVQAPKDCLLMSVGFQGGIFNKTKIWIDDVLVEQSLEPMEIQNYHYSGKVPLDSIYPNSHGNL